MFVCQVVRVIKQAVCRAITYNIEACQHTMKTFIIVTSETDLVVQVAWILFIQVA